MKTLNVTRDKSFFDSYARTFTASESFSTPDSTSIGFTSRVTIHSGGVESTVTQETRSTTVLGGTGFNITGSTYYEGAGSSILNATQYTEFESFSSTARASYGTGSTTTSGSNSTSYSGGSSYSNANEYYITSTTDTGYTVNLTTTGTVNATTTAYTFSESTLLTTTATTTAVSNRSSSIGGIMPSTYAVYSPITVSFSSTTHTTTESTIAASTYLDVGLAFTAENEWLWTFSNTTASFNSLPQFVSTLAVSVSEGTLWPNEVSSVVSYALFAGSSTGSHTITGNATTFTLERIITSTTTGTTITSGSSFSRASTTASFSLYTTTSSTETWGMPSYTIEALSTSSYSSVEFMPEQITIHTIYRHGLSDYKSTTLLSTAFNFQATTYTTTLDAHLTAYSYSLGASHYEQGETLGRTSTYAQNRIELLSYTAPATFIKEQPAYGAFISPSELRSDGSIYAFGGNLSIGASQIFYPSIASIYKNVAMPALSSFSTTNTDSLTWRYKWESDTLNYSKISSYVSESSTLSATTASSGVFSTVSSVGSFYSSGTKVLGGYQDLKTAAETAYFPKKAVIGVGISTNGSTSTYQTVVASTHSATESGRMVVEKTLPAYATYATYGDLEPLIFARHKMS